jgi:hypothetical protein
MALLSQVPHRYRAAYRRTLNDVSMLYDTLAARGEVAFAAIGDEEWDAAVAADDARDNGRGRKDTCC